MGAAAGIRFSTRELRDLGIAWLALGLAFTLFAVSFTPGVSIVSSGPELFTSGFFIRVFAISVVTVGVGFLLHELAHKVVAIRFGQVAEFRADYSMLGFAVIAGLAGFIFAAPGAVYHGGRNVTARENGLIALAGPVTNLLIAAAFAPALLLGSGVVAQLGQVGVWINLLLAGFNMIPFGPLDGRKVRDWSLTVFVPAAIVCIGLGALSFLFLSPAF